MNRTDFEPHTWQSSFGSFNRPYHLSPHHKVGIGDRAVETSDRSVGPLVTVTPACVWVRIQEWNRF